MSSADYIQALQQQFQIDIEQLLLYDSLRDKSQRRFICQYWLRGTCCYSGDFCHFAHGIDYLDYHVDSITELKSLPTSEEVAIKLKIIGFPKQYFVVHQYQQHPFAQQQLKQYHEFLDKAYDEQKIYTLREIKYQRSIKPILLNTMYLDQIVQFYHKILQQLKVTIIPKQLFVQELNRVGFSFLGKKLDYILGSHFARPHTIINHLFNQGICFQRNLNTDLIITGYDDKFQNQQSLKILKGNNENNEQNNIKQEQTVNINKETQFTQKDHKQNIGEDGEGNQNEEIDEDDDDDESVSINDEEKGKTTFIIQATDLNTLEKKYTKIIQDLLKEHPEYEKITNIDEFAEIIFKATDFNDKVDPYNNNQEILPSLTQFLTLTDQIWDEFAEKNGFSNMKFTNSRESGITVQVIMLNFTQEQKEELMQYLKKPKVKYYLCQYWLRGICIFKKEDCRFAHGVDDLQLEFNIKRDLDILDKEQRPLRYNQKPLINHRTYKTLYLHQYKMIEEGSLQKHQKKNQFQIDNIKEYRDKIREHILRSNISQFYYKISNGQPQSKSELMKYFFSVGFVQRGVDLSDLKIVKLLVNNDIAFEKESIVKLHTNEDQQDQLSKKERKKATQKQILLIPFNNYNTYQQFYDDLIFSAIQNVLQQNIQLPIQEQLLKKEIYKQDQVLEMPGLYQYFLRHPKKKYTFIDYFQECILGQVKQKLNGKIHPEVFSQIQEDGQNLIQFEADIVQITQIVEALYGVAILKNQPTLNVQKLQMQIEMKAHDNDKHNAVINYLFKEKQHKILAINGSLYASMKFENIEQRIKKCKCGQQYNYPAQILSIDETILTSKILELQSLIDKDVRNTIIIDNPEKLLITQTFFSSNVNYVAVDLEGRLKYGDIWLVQFGVMINNLRLIFIFDLMKAKYLEADLVFHSQMLEVIKQIIENQQICKVFHDCKRDSQAFHHNKICPKNLTDTSCTYQLLQYLKLNNQEGNRKQKSIIQVTKEVLQVLTPPINTVLTQFQALYGGNELKEEMHSKFNQPNGDDFFIRPNPSFMYYSARDVEDLVQVYKEMEKQAPDFRNVIEKMSNKNKEFYLK